MRQLLLWVISMAMCLIILGNSCLLVMFLWKPHVPSEKSLHWKMVPPLKPMASLKTFRNYIFTVRINGPSNGGGLNQKKTGKIAIFEGSGF